MTGKWMRLKAAASSFVLAVALLCLAAASSPTLGAAQTAGQNPMPNSERVRQNPPPSAQPPQTPPAQARDRNTTENPYKPASTVVAADVQYPFHTAADGLVVFSVALGPAGEIRKINVVNDVPPFTEAAEQSLRNWKFIPASENGRPEDSAMLVAFVFRHAVYVADEPAFTPILPGKASAANGGGLTLPGIRSISYSAYPASTIAMGAVVVQATVKADGATGGISIVRDLPGDFGALAVKAAKHWQFQPALLDGRAVMSKVAIAFVFSSRALNPF